MATSRSGKQQNAALRKGLCLIASAYQLPIVPSGGAFFPRAGFVDLQVSALQVSTVEGFDCFFTIGLVGHFDKTETFGAPSLPVGNNIHSNYRTMFCKQCLKFIFSCRIWQVSYVYVHLLFLSVCADFHTTKNQTHKFLGRMRLTASRIFQATPLSC